MPMTSVAFTLACRNQPCAGDAGLDCAIDPEHAGSHKRRLARRGGRAKAHRRHQRRCGTFHRRVQPAAGRSWAEWERLANLANCGLWAKTCDSAREATPPAARWSLASTTQTSEMICISFAKETAQDWVECGTTARPRRTPPCHHDVDCSERGHDAVMAGRLEVEAASLLSAAATSWRSRRVIGVVGSAKACAGAVGKASPGACARSHGWVCSCAWPPEVQRRPSTCWRWWGVGGGCGWEASACGKRLRHKHQQAGGGTC
ncbi:uncharacterized protein CC84DRAFT_294100 [Paraphaeosphaeria sporulosa]|uniref:Uncharacterized protein n=1 Tax=Paraphaeosphaeria sporulosa TaxID=1460663 RepID=A0A177C0A9_9PLEO|nr:uncharacterized protein CC84DRAFT_294100 [Paraphaeosphaeria sporulosa]OAG00282.1 hypothetical protein CC84DRAFT_294100 [Paraphaeosphaeria sporulosa]